MISLKKFFGVSSEPQQAGGSQNQYEIEVITENEQPKKQSWWRRMLQDWSNQDAADLAYDDSRP